MPTTRRVPWVATCDTSFQPSPRTTWLESCCSSGSARTRWSAVALKPSEVSLADISAHRVVFLQHGMPGLGADHHHANIALDHRIPYRRTASHQLAIRLGSF